MFLSSLFWKEISFSRFDIFCFKFTISTLKPCLITFLSSTKNSELVFPILVVLLLELVTLSFWASFKNAFEFFGFVRKVNFPPLLLALKEVVGENYRFAKEAELSYWAKFLLLLFVIDPFELARRKLRTLSLLLTFSMASAASALMLFLDSLATKTFDFWRRPFFLASSWLYFV